MNVLKFLIQKSKWVIAMSIFFGVISGACSTLLITSIQKASQNVGQPGNALYIFAAAALGFLLTSLLGQLPLFHLVEGAVYELRVTMIKRILNSRLRFIEEVGSHRLFATLTNDVNVISNGMARIPTTLIYGVIVLGCFGYLGYLNWKVLVAMIAFVITMIVVYRVISKLATAVFTTSRETGDDLFKHFRTVTDGNKELKMHAKRRQAFMDELLMPTAKTYKKSRIKGLISFQLANSVGNLGFFMVMGFVVFLLPSWQGLDANTVNGVVLVFVFMMSPLGSLFDVMPTVSQAGVALRKVASLGLDLDANVKEVAITDPEVTRFEHITLRGVTHTYYREQQDECFTLGPIDMDLRRGELVYLVGGNGSGKSTLGKIIAGLYEPEEGKIIIDGKEVTDDNRDWFRQHFSTVFSDFFLFDQFLGIETEAMQERADRFLDELHLNHKVKVKDGELSTTRLSTGQRKRLALLISYMEDREIYFFDEWASDQDPHFKEVFYKKLLPDLQKRGKTVLAITHDDRYFHLADRFLKLENGQLVDQSTPGLERA